MTETVNIWLPESKYTRMTFLQAILEDSKKTYTCDEIRQCGRIREHLPEYAVKRAWPLVRDDPLIVAYLPDEELDLERWPDRRFFWGIVYTIRPEWVEDYISQCIAQRDRMHLVNRMATKTVAISAGWREKLAAHDFASR